jgi:predicted DCC family thiol-disulfide oxidoreductase YuxK
MTSIVLFDGVCHFCSKSVQFIYKRDPNEVFLFASLQGEAARELRREHSISDHVDSLILIEDNRVFFRSTAALRICRNLSGGWRLLYVFVVIPIPIRDWVYNLIAKNRYRWFGKTESCELPSKEVRNRFLE